jgi:diketogulonate reductase-like aldo/keto reductase
VFCEKRAQIELTWKAILIYLLLPSTETTERIVEKFNIQDKTEIYANPVWV